VTGLAYVRNRDYSASLGRFIELDPIGFSAGDNNWYRFVGNGPTGKVDPSGLCEPDDVIMGLPMDYWFPMPPQPATGPRVENGIVVDDQGIPLVSGPLRPWDIGTSAGGSQFDNFIEAKRIAKEKIHEVAIDVAINTAAAGIPIGSAGRVAAQGRNVSRGAKCAAARGARALAEPVYKTTKEAKVAAEAIGFKLIKETVHGGQAVFKRGNRFITRDMDGHNGGAWKMADSVKNLGSKETRTGTFDINLNRIGD
jgi:uncharacterized protein RhaS with RHS repeats